MRLVFRESRDLAIYNDTFKKKMPKNDAIALLGTLSESSLGFESRLPSKVKVFFG